MGPAAGICEGQSPLVAPCSHTDTRALARSFPQLPFPRVCFLASSYGQGALESALRLN